MVTLQYYLIHCHDWLSGWLCGRYIREMNIMKTRLFKYIDNFTPPKKNEKFQMKSCDIFHISALDIYCKPQFYYIKVGFEGVKII